MDVYDGRDRRDWAIVTTLSPDLGMGLTLDAFILMAPSAVREREMLNRDVRAENMLMAVPQSI